MGTRADFYIGKGTAAEWLGSIAWDGYVDGIPARLLRADTERKYRNAVAAFFADRNDVTLPAMGWPWPWQDSHTTDYAYAFDAGEVWVHGTFWHKASEHEVLYSEAGQRRYERLKARTPRAEFPQMDRASAALSGARSGLMVLTASSRGLSIE